MRAFTLRIEESHDGLVCVTSPEIRSLFVAEETLADALMAASHLVASLHDERRNPGEAKRQAQGEPAVRGPA